MMRAVTGLVLGALLGLAIGWFAGKHQGALAATAARDAQAVRTLTELIDSHAALVAQANAASKILRTALAARARADAQTTQEFRDALARSAAARPDCVFPLDVMRELERARDQAAAAAAGGILGALPGPPGPDGPER